MQVVIASLSARSRSRCGRVVVLCRETSGCDQKQDFMTPPGSQRAEIISTDTSLFRQNYWRCLPGQTCVLIYYLFFIIIISSKNNLC